MNWKKHFEFDVKKLVVGKYYILQSKHGQSLEVLEENALGDYIYQYTTVQCFCGISDDELLFFPSPRINNGNYYVEEDVVRPATVSEINDHITALTEKGKWPL